MEPVTTNSYLQELSLGIGKEWAEGNFSDVEVVVEDQKFNCHRIILAALSKYFSVMFNSGFKESRQKSVEIKGMKGDAFRLVLEYIYTGKDIVSNDNVNDVLLSASMLQIETLQEMCRKFLEMNLSIENCIGFWRLTCLHDIKELEPIFWKFLIKRFPSVVNCMEYLVLSSKELKRIIKDDELNTPSEEFVCDMVMKWFKGNEDVGTDGLKKVIKHLKFELMDKTHVQNWTEQFSEFERKESIKLMIGEILSKKQDEQALDSSYRKEEMICMVGTRSRMPNPSKTEVQCYSYQDKKQFHLAPLPIEPGPCFAVCSLNNDIYISGGYNQQSLVLHFNSKQNKWYQYNCMVEGRWGHGMVALNGYLYMVGGITKSMDTISSIERFDPNTNTCTKVGDLKLAVSSMTVTFMGSKIYAFGGKSHDRQASTIIQIYNLNDNSAEIVAELPPACTGEVGKAISFGNEMYIVYRDGNIVLFGEDGSSEVVGFTQKFEHFGVVVKDNRFLIIGCESNNFTSFLFEPTLKQLFNVPSEFKAPMCNFHLLKVDLSKKYLAQS